MDTTVCFFLCRWPSVSRLAAWKTHLRRSPPHPLCAREVCAVEQPIVVDIQAICQEPPTRYEHKHLTQSNSDLGLSSRKTPILTAESTSKGHGFLQESWKNIERHLTENNDIHHHHHPLSSIINGSDGDELILIQTRAHDGSANDQRFSENGI